MKKKNYSRIYFLDNNTMIPLSNEGFFINDEAQAKYLIARNIHTPEEMVIQWCKENFSNKDKIFVDIGAHIGTYSWLLVDSFKHVYAFEPNPSVFNVLCANIHLRGYSNNITPYRIGLSDRNSTLQYYERGLDGGGNGFENTRATDIGGKLIDVRTLDSYNIDNIGFIKIDVEGHEKNVLMGSKETLKRNGYPPILFESWEPGEHDELEDKKVKSLRKELFDYLKTIGYSIIPVNGWKEIFLAVHQ
jgi:FkbM family methyltransferase